VTIQEQINAGGEVLLPLGEVHLSAPLYINNPVHIRGNNTILVSDLGNPVIDIGPTSYTSVSRIKCINGGIYFRPRNNNSAPSFINISDLFVDSAQYAINDDWSASWMTTIERVWASVCSNGFIKNGGTTTTYNNCHASNISGRAWNLYGVYDSKIISSAFDGCVANSQPAAQFVSCRGLSISSFDFESNISKGGALIYISNCDALNLSSIYSVKNFLSPIGNNASYLVHINNSKGSLSGVSLGGIPRDTPDIADGSPLGHTVTLIITGSNISLLVSGCTIAPCRKNIIEQTAFGLVDQSGKAVILASSIYPDFGPGQN